MKRGVPSKATQLAKNRSAQSSPPKTTRETVCTKLPEEMHLYLRNATASLISVTMWPRPSARK